MTNAIDSFSNVFEDDRTAVSIADPGQPDCPLVFVNREFENLTQYSRDEVIGKNCRFLQGSNSSDEDVEKIRDAIKKGAEADCVVVNYKKYGDEFLNFLIIKPFLYNNQDQYIAGFQYDLRVPVKPHILLKQMERVEFELNKVDALRKQTQTALRASMKTRADILARRLLPSQ